MVSDELWCCWVLYRELNAGGYEDSCSRAASGRRLRPECHLHVRARAHGEAQVCCEADLSRGGGGVTPERWGEIPRHLDVGMWT